MMTLILWILLFIFSWPLALMALILYPFFLILSIPFRLLGITLDALFALLNFAERANAPVADLQVHQPGLEDVFLNLTGRALRA